MPPFLNPERIRGEGPFGTANTGKSVRRPVDAVVHGARCGVVHEGRTEARWRLYEGWLRLT
ncbi:hypothetical protein ES332_A10G263300v1 [Gossypium tomentosum]|uniref:Uncharacterized protein n=1 Tax=Gossypium tomentosum TaxID=34277 RepID=A0A5D2NVC9_GOSTO|nr:hypothetical protein ES332_A10G263300v1 [Gossypium tomentosum]